MIEVIYLFNLQWFRGQFLTSSEVFLYIYIFYVNVNHDALRLKEACKEKHGAVSPGLVQSRFVSLCTVQSGAPSFVCLVLNLVVRPRCCVWPYSICCLETFADLHKLLSAVVYYSETLLLLHYVSIQFISSTIWSVFFFRFCKAVCTAYQR